MCLFKLYSLNLGAESQHVTVRLGEESQHVTGVFGAEPQHVTGAFRGGATAFSRLVNKFLAF